jgi:hypothetical protein
VFYKPQTFVWTVILPEYEHHCEQVLSVFTQNARRWKDREDVVFLLVPASRDADGNPFGVFCQPVALFSEYFPGQVCLAPCTWYDHDGHLQQLVSRPNRLGTFVNLPTNVINAELNTSLNSSDRSILFEEFHCVFDFWANEFADTVVAAEAMFGVYRRSMNHYMTGVRVETDQEFETALRIASVLPYPVSIHRVDRHSSNIYNGSFVATTLVNGPLQTMHIDGTWSDVIVIPQEVKHATIDSATVIRRLVHHPQTTVFVQAAQIEDIVVDN